jgi:hypothetical protein
MTIVFLAAGLVVGVVARSRSRWFIADALGATAASLVSVAMFGRITDVEDKVVKARWTPEMARPLWERADAIVHWVEIVTVAVVFAAVIVAGRHRANRARTRASHARDHAVLRSGRDGARRPRAHAVGAVVKATHVWRVAREVTARWVLVPASTVIATLGMLAVRSLDVGKGGADGMLNGTWAATLVISVIVGMSLLGEELSNGRLSFYFTRPFGPSAIFGGKMLGGALLALVIQGVVIACVGSRCRRSRGRGARSRRAALPTWSAHASSRPSLASYSGWPSALQSSRGHGGSPSISRALRAVAVISTWVVLHVTREMIFALRGDPTAPSGYNDRVTVLELSTLAVTVVGLAVATARAFAGGRPVRARAHAALSMTLWPIIVPAATALLVATMAWF